jgi:KUP system potassium uptake protein
VLVGLFGAALLYGDGVITPAISVLAAVEGTTVAAPSLDAYVLPAAIVILVGLFVAQRKGTTAIGRVFGPIMIVWFSTLAVLGGTRIAEEPGVFRAVWPGHAVRFFDLGHGFHQIVLHYGFMQQPDVPRDLAQHCADHAPFDPGASATSSDASRSG